MKYYTKEWYRSSQGNKEKVDERVQAYFEYYKTIRDKIPDDFAQKFHMRDSVLLEMHYEDQNLIMRFDPSHGFGNITQLTFVNATIIESDPIQEAFEKLSWQYSEIYIVGKQYEIHILWEGIGFSLWQMSIRCDRIDLKEGYFRNVGRCVNCGDIVSDPNREKYDKRLFSGRMVDGKWYCERCLSKRIPICELIRSLHRAEDPENRERAIATLSESDEYDLRFLILPWYLGDKDYWDNIAIVIQRRGPKRVKSILPYIFEWIKNLNWPGAAKMADFLTSFPVDEAFMEAYEGAIEKAAQTRDISWLEYLPVCVVRGNVKREDFRNTAHYDLMEQYSHAFWLYKG